jgi:hypothetical protein
VSAKSGHNLHEMFRSLAYDILDMNDMQKVIELYSEN